ncbi:SulP family inorganic anion transporter [Comamonas piscis]|uniref:SulP family inorganic anion transporter n=1 Tax=Comamonas piscis TaxID=1562974 RepID=A0A7G5EK20_9BURK|nr:SulP family inorganic anion transporter [Comamonas piscis]QMV74345.1 SulP family inorganic anion transporter [Comamonas piscis]WSO32791.1 SulP family inorganic anion transporter [Comamonas piscis]
MTIALRPSRADALAALSMAGLLLPEAVAYSSIAGLPPQAGVIGLLAGLLTYGITGSSRFAIVSATSSSAAVLASAMNSVLHVSTDAQHMMGLAMVLLAGIYFIFAGLARMGSISNFIAKPVLTGFSLGLALTIAIKQLPNAVGVHPAHSDIFRFSYELLQQWPQWNLAGLALLVAALVLLRLLRRWPLVPAALLVIVIGIALDATGYCARWGIAPVGAMQLGFSHPSLPSLAFAEWLRVGQLAAALALILYAESYGSIRNFAVRHGDKVQSNRDLMALGLSNVVSSLFQGMPVGAGYSATSANEVAGAQSKAAGLLTAALIALLLWLCLPWIEKIPEPLLAAIVMFAVSHTLSLKSVRPYFQWRRDRTLVVLAFLAVLVFGVLDGLLVSMGVSILLLLRDYAQPRLSWLARLPGSHDFVDVAHYANAEQPAGMLIARPAEPLFFGNAEPTLGLMARRVVDQKQAAGAAPLHTLVLSLEATSDLDGTTIIALSEFATLLEKQQVCLVIARARNRVREVLERAQIPQLPADAYAAFSVDDAVTAALAGASSQATAG